MQSGDYEQALRWFYETEILGAGDLSDELSSRIVHCLERLGRHHAAQAALENRVEMDPQGVRRAEDDPLVARVGQTQIHRSEVMRALDSLPPEVASNFATPEGQQELLKKYVADELLWRQAVKLEYDRDPEVTRRQTEVLKQLAVARFVEKEVFDKIQVDDADLRNYFAANRDRYQQSQDGAETQEVTFDQARQQVERDYQMFKMSSAYNELIDTELSTQDVELFPERMGDG
jgi:tetratricopeptide (TPR) repeat protein